MNGKTYAMEVFKGLVKFGAYGTKLAAAEACGRQAKIVAFNYTEGKSVSEGVRSVMASDYKHRSSLGHA